MSATVAGVQMQGDWQLMAHEPAAPRTVAGTANTPLGQLASLLFGLDGVQGALGGIAGRIVGQGASIAELAASLDVYLAIARGGFTYGNQPGQRPVAFTFDSLAMQVPAGGELTAQASGSLLDQPLSATLDAGRLVDMLATGRVPLDLRARSRSVRARLHGVVGPQAASQGGQALLTLELKAAQARDAAAWLGFSARLAAPLAMGGRLVFDDGNWVVSGGRFAVGRSGVSAQVSQTRRGSQPLLRATIEADSIDVQELQALFARAQADVSRREGTAAPPAGNLLDIPVLPAELDLTDTDLSLALRRVQGTRLDIRDLAFDAAIRDGNMDASPLRMAVLGVPMRGALALDLRSRRPGGQWWLFAEKADVGGVLRRLGLSQDIDAIVDELSLHLRASGQRLGDLLDNARLTVEANGGQISVGDRNTGQRLNIGLEAMTLAAEQGAALAGQIRGRLQGQPVQIELGTAPAGGAGERHRDLPIRGDRAWLAATEVALSGSVGRLHLARRRAARRRRASCSGGAARTASALAGIGDLVGVALPA
ncbi:MAG: hypothetical protein R3E68_21930 [Burkholderiaceae bacterium]